MLIILIETIDPINFRAFSMDTAYLPLLVGLIGVFGALLGVLATAFSTEARIWLENRRLEKRQLKSTLFHQIQLWGETVALDKEIANYFVKTLNTSLKNLGLPEELADAVFGDIPNRLMSSLEKIKAEGTKDVLQKHEETITNLSPIDPLLAIDMSHRARIRLPEQVNAFITEVNNITEERTETTDEFIEHIIEWQSQKARRRMIDSLEKGIVEIAWRIDWTTWWGAKKLIRSWRDEIKADIKAEVHDYIIEIVKFSMKENGKITNNGDKIKLHSS